MLVRYPVVQPNDRIELQFQYGFALLKLAEKHLAVPDQIFPGTFQSFGLSFNGRSMPQSEKP